MDVWFCCLLLVEVERGFPPSHKGKKNSRALFPFFLCRFTWKIPFAAISSIYVDQDRCSGVSACKFTTSFRHRVRLVRHHNMDILISYGGMKFTLLSDGKCARKKSSSEGDRGDEVNL